MRQARIDQTPNHAVAVADQRAAIATQRRNALAKDAEAKVAVGMLLAERVAGELKLRNTTDAAEANMRSEREATDARLRNATEAAAARLRDVRSSGRARLHNAAETAAKTGRDVAELAAERDERSACALTKARKRARVAESKEAASAPEAGELAELKKQLAAMKVLPRAFGCPRIRVHCMLKTARSPCTIASSPALHDRPPSYRPLLR
jgi:hypothetical protein